MFFSFLFFSNFRTNSLESQNILFSQDPAAAARSFFTSQDASSHIVSSPVVGENCFKASSPVASQNPQVLGNMGSGIDTKGGSKEMTEYVVQEGDTPSGVADKFGISLNTVLWANDLTQGSSISPGDKLTVLPTSGVSHLVKEGESISYLAALYDVSGEKIVEFNDLKEDKIIVGDLVIIPGGEKQPVSTNLAGAASTGATPVAKSYFICPISQPCGITQGLHWHNAVDFSNGGCGEPIYASAGGTIQKVGYNQTAGNYVRILHYNGVVTFYGHMSRRLVYPGQTVHQGQVIGYVGNTGYTIGRTGCHVHFEVRGAANPFAY